MKRLVCILMTTMVLAWGSAMADPKTGKKVEIYTVKGKIEAIEGNRIYMDDTTLVMANNVSVVTRKGQPGTIKDVGRGASVELLILMPDYVVQEIRLK